MPEYKQNRLVKLIKARWIESGAWPDFLQVMVQALSLEQAGSAGTDESLSRLARLPGLCCQAAGGETQWADALTAAWLLFYFAADIMDSVQDEDEPASWWVERGPGLALNAATGLYFSASLILNDLYHAAAMKGAAGEIVDSFYRGLLQMSSGQHRDIENANPSLEQYWQNVGAKSGTFFALACRSGARLAIDDQDRLDGFQQFGHHLGLMIQIYDDLEDLQAIDSSRSIRAHPEIERSLPMIYALEVSSPDMRARLKSCLAIIKQKPDVYQDLMDILDQAGAAVYLLAELENHRSVARKGLETAKPLNPAGEHLFRFLDTF